MKLLFLYLLNAVYSLKCYSDQEPMMDSRWWNAYSVRNNRNEIF